LGGVGDGLKKKEFMMWEMMMTEEEIEFWVVFLGEEQLLGQGAQPEVEAPVMVVLPNLVERRGQN